MFDVCIVGAGAMGSAAAYHLSKLDPTGNVNKNTRQFGVAHEI